MTKNESLEFENELEYERYKNNLNQAIKIRNGFMKFRNITLFFVLYSICYKLLMKCWITSGIHMFVSLAGVFIISKIILYVFDELILAIQIIRRNRIHKKNTRKEVKTK